MEDAPGFEVGDGLFDGPSEFVDRGVVVSGFLADLAGCRFSLRRGHSASEVALVRDELGGVSSVEEVVGVDCGHVMGAAWQRVGDPHDAPGQGGHDLDVDPGGVVLAGVQLGVVAPGPAGQEGPIDQMGGVGGDLVDGGYLVCQDLGDDRGEFRHGTADAGLGHTELFRDLGLGPVGAQVDEHRHQCPVEAQHIREFPGDVGFCDPVEDMGELCGGQACAILHHERFVS